MNVDGGLSFVVGPMGAGKTLHAVRHGVSTMLSGRWWVTNIPLYDDALMRAAFHVCPASRRNRLKVYDKLQERYRYTEDLEHALLHAADRKIRRPGVAMVRLDWDEALGDLDARGWDGNAVKGRTKDDRAQLFERVPMLRKNGVAGFLLVQHEELLDKNARRIANWYIRLQNQRENTRVMGMRVKVLPPLFLAFWYQTNQADKSSRAARAMKIERYPLSWHRKLYDTLGLYGISRDDAENDRTIWLGTPRKALPVSPRDEGHGHALSVAG